LRMKKEEKLRRAFRKIVFRVLIVISWCGVLLMLYFLIFGLATGYKIMELRPVIHALLAAVLIAAGLHFAEATLELLHDIHENGRISGLSVEWIYEIMKKDNKR